MSVFNGLGAAARYAGVSRNAILLWTDQYDIGELRDGRWMIDKEKLDAFLALRAQIAELRASLRKSA